MDDGVTGGSVGVVVPAAGSGRRMGGTKKQYLHLAGRPVLLRALDPFLARDDVAEIRVALPREDADDPPTWLVEADPRIAVVGGGASRGASVRSGLDALGRGPGLVAIHDGVRPLLDAETLERCIAVARRGIGAVAGWPAVDTMKVADAEGRIVRTPDRDTLWHAQTPQVFPRDALVRAYEAAREEGGEATDDASLMEGAGLEVRMVPGSPRNVKVTRPEDLAVAEALLGRAAEPEKGGAG